MINIGPGELLAICAIALIVLGPDKLPQALRTLGRVTAELRRVSSGFQEDIRHAMDDALHDDEDIKPRERSRSLSGEQDTELDDALPTSVDTLDEVSDRDAASDPAEDDDAADVAGGQDLQRPAKKNGSSGATGS